jgi:hypothetical protein
MSNNKHGFNFREQESILSKAARNDIVPIDEVEEQKPKETFASPLNKRLDEMKKNLHNLMFSASLD